MDFNFHTIQDGLTHGFEKLQEWTGEARRANARWAGYAIKEIRALPQNMQQSPKIAATAWAIATVTSFYLAHLFANYGVRKCFGQPQNPSSLKERTIQELKSSIFFTPTMIAATLSFSYLTNYQLGLQHHAIIAGATLILKAVPHIFNVNGTGIETQNQNMKTDTDMINLQYLSDIETECDFSSEKSGSETEEEEEEFDEDDHSVASS